MCFCAIIILLVCVCLLYLFEAWGYQNQVSPKSDALFYADTHPDSVHLIKMSLPVSQWQRRQRSRHHSSAAL